MSLAGLKERSEPERMTTLLVFRLSRLASERSVQGVLVTVAKFSPNGCLPDTNPFIYDSQNGRLLVDVPIQVNQKHNRSLVWASDSIHSSNDL